MEKIGVRNLKIEDYQALRKSMIQAYKNDLDDDIWDIRHIRLLLDIFPEGQIAVVVDDIVVGCALSLIVSYDKLGDNHTYVQAVGNYTFNTHTYDGDVLYGIDVFIDPEYRGLRLGRRLYDARKELCENLNLRAVIAGGRIPNYAGYANTLTPKEYIANVRRGEIEDPVLNFQLSNDFHVKKVMKGYLKGDTNSLEFATMLEWNNIYYTPKPELINNQKSIVRIGLVQWLMRPLKDLTALFEQIEFFVDAVSDYKSDFILFPELFNAPLMAEFNHLSENEAIRELSKYTDEIHQKFKEFAVSYNINIITGSMPYMEDEKIYNVGFLCRRDGSSESYRKLHITPNEEQYWGIHGGNELIAFDTDSGKIGVLICYDVEFPELGRLLAEQGCEILFVPFLTDTQNGYTRVRRCAQSRAIENECYVVIAGSVGNLPKVNNMDIQYAQSAVFTPSDFAFPNNGVKAEATPNTEMTLLADVNLDLLKELHNFGSVTNLKDRRTDLYELITKKK